MIIVSKPILVDVLMHSMEGVKPNCILNGHGCNNLCIVCPSVVAATIVVTYGQCYDILHRPGTRMHHGMPQLSQKVP